MDFLEKAEDTFETTLAERTYQEVCGTVEAVRGLARDGRRVMSTLQEMTEQQAGADKRDMGELCQVVRGSTEKYAGRGDGTVVLSRAGLNVLQLKRLFYQEKELAKLVEHIIAAFYSAHVSETAYENQPRTESARKKAVELRVSGVGLAYRLSLIQKGRTLPEGVTCWRDICEREDELAVVKRG